MRVAFIVPAVKNKRGQRVGRRDSRSPRKESNLESDTARIEAAGGLRRLGAAASAGLAPAASG